MGISPSYRRRSGIAGQLKTLVDPVPYVASVANITTSEGGADAQTDDSYREDIHGAPERFSTAGPDGAYIYHAKRAYYYMKRCSIGACSIIDS